jgi:AAA+ ATPase superfamily predicted ATPase
VEALSAFDLRAYEGLGYNSARLAEMLGSGISSLLRRYRGIGAGISRVRGVTAAGPSVLIEPSRAGGTLQELLSALNRWAEERGARVVLAFDEAQLLGGFRLKFPSLFAYIYDQLDHIQVILTGSEVGLLYDMLKLEDPASPLYGRYVEEVRLKRIDEARALEFLQLGFREAGLRPKGEDLARAVEQLDGIIGWLAF